MTSRRRSATGLATAAALLAVAWVAAGPASPPLYDGLNQPAEPYRFLHPPPGGTAAQAATESAPVVTPGSSPAIAWLTAEQPPQAQVLVQQGSFALPAGTSSLTVTITPVEPAVAAPAGMRFDGNVYRFSVTAGSTPLTTLQHAGTIVLRGPAGVSGVTVWMLQGTAWHQLDTKPVGSADTYAANVTTLGDAVLITSQSSTATTPGGGGSSGGGSGAVIGIVIAAVALGVVIAAVWLLRRRGARGATPPRRGPPPRGRPPRGRPPRRR